uniref:Tail protein n=1 Tax=viral metagenome TaxID=1070528 RepID=A0A6M3XPX5_9ZZZZ
MALGNYSGISLVEYDTAGNSFATVVSLGKPLADSAGPGFETPEVETGAGTTLYTGVKKEHVFNITDLSKFAALETKMLADTLVDVRVTDVGSNLETVALSASVKVKKMYGSAVGGRNYFELKVTSFATS